MEFEGYKRGVNLGGWLSQCEHKKDHYDNFIKKDDIKIIASWGLDHVRLPVDFELIQTKEGELKEDGFQYIDSCIEWCKEYGLNMILDVHKTAGYSFDADSKCNDFFYNENLQYRFLDMWEELARRYSEYDDFVTFELLNEVVDIKVSDIWNGIIKRAVKVIRQYAPYTYILIGGVYNNAVSTVKLLEEPMDDYIVYTFHFYEPLIFTHQSAGWIPEMSQSFSMEYPCQAEDILRYTKENLDEVNYEINHNIIADKVKIMGPEFFESAFEEAIQIAKQRNVSLYCGEYGVIDRADLVSTLNWYRDINHVFKKYNISRAAWTYKGKDFGITDQHYSEILDQLVLLL